MGSAWLDHVKRHSVLTRKPLKAVLKLLKKLTKKQQHRLAKKPRKKRTENAPVKRRKNLANRVAKNQPNARVAHAVVKLTKF